MGEEEGLEYVDELPLDLECLAQVYREDIAKITDRPAFALIKTPDCLSQKQFNQLAEIMKGTMGCRGCLSHHTAHMEVFTDRELGELGLRRLAAPGEKEPDLEIEDLKALSPKDGDILVLTLKDKYVSQDDVNQAAAVMSSLVGNLYETIGINVTTLVLPGEHELSQLTDERLRELGLQRIPETGAVSE